MPLRSSTFPVESSLRMLKGWHSRGMVRDGVRLGGCEDDVALAVSTDDRLGAADGAQEGGFDGGRLEADHEHREGKSSAHGPILPPLAGHASVEGDVSGRAGRWRG